MMKFVHILFQESAARNIDFEGDKKVCDGCIRPSLLCVNSLYADKFVLHIPSNALTSSRISSGNGASKLIFFPVTGCSNPR